MLMLRDHEVTDYEALLDMDTTDVSVLSEDDRQCLDTLGRHLVETDNYRRFSVWLLHKHFHPWPGEVFVERALIDERVKLTGPTPRIRFAPESLTATALRFGSESDDLSLVGMEFAVGRDLGATRPFGDKDEGILRGLRDLLVTYGKTDRFGVRLIRDPLGLADDEILVETCSLEDRVSSTRMGSTRTEDAGQRRYDPGNLPGLLHWPFDLLSVPCPGQGPEAGVRRVNRASRPVPPA